MLCKLDDADSGELLIAVTVVGARAQGNGIANKIAESSVVVPQVKPTHHIEGHSNAIMTVNNHALASSCRKGKSPANVHDTDVCSSAVTDADGNHQTYNSDANIDTTALPIMSSTDQAYQIVNSATTNAMEAASFSTSEMLQRSLSGSLHFCPSDTPLVNTPLNKNVDTSAATPVDNNNHAKLTRSRKSVTSEVKKTRRATLPPSQQTRRSTFLFNSSSSGHSLHSSSSSNQSQKRTRLSLPSDVAGSSDNRGLANVEKVAHSKTWKRNIFQFAFHKHKQKRPAPL